MGFNEKSLDFIGRGIADMSAYSPMGFNRGKPDATHINRYIYPLQFERLAHDVIMWREAMREMERSYNPQRVMAMRMFIDTINNPEIKSIKERWEDLTLQRDYFIYQIKDGKQVISNDLSQQIRELYWFDDYIKYTLDAIPWGYSLINMGDIVDDGFPNITFTPRQNIIPDGRYGDGQPILKSMVYSIDGIHIKDHPLINLCNHWISTPTDIGVSPCGYGLLYSTALFEIHLRHITEWNMDFLEMYGMPIKKGTTSKTGEARDDFERFLRSGGSNQWALLDKATNDDITYEWAQSVGTAYKSYESLETRLKGALAKMWLGHEDAMSSTPGKLGGQQAANKDGFNESLIEQAMNSKKVRCGDFVCRKVNEIFAPRMRKLGKYVGSKHIAGLLPEGYKLGLLNDSEESQVRRRINAERSVAADWVEKMNKAGWDIDQSQLEEFMKLKLTPAVPENKIIQLRKSETTIKSDTDGKETTTKADE